MTAVSPARLSLLTLGVEDLGRATAFYTAVGFERSSASTDGVTFLRGAGVVLSLYPRGELAADAHVPAEGSGFRAVALACNVDEADQVQATFDHWVAAGATPVKAPERAFWGGTSSYVADPDGFLWEIAHNPFFPFTDDGRIDLPA
jgi:catechol 2,3-dioxygenase-like lactoylglutathione lyase family enzyme